MSKCPVRVLIVDDESERKEIYDDFFGRLSTQLKSYSITPLIPQSPSEALFHLDSRAPCLVILDLVLTGEWRTQASLIYSRIRDLGFPIVLLSGRLEERGSDRDATAVLAQLKAIPKLGFVPYATSIRSHCRTLVGARNEDPLPDDTLGMWHFMIAEALGHSVSWNPAREDEISFLHITDTHFGHDITPDYMNVVAMQTGVESRAVASNNIYADFVLWTGDITDHGYPREFDLALQFAKDLRQANFLTDPCLFSITPGNHDCCWPLALSSRLEMQSTSEQHDGSSPTGAANNWEWRLTNTTVNSELWRFSLLPFHRFYEELVGEPASSEGCGGHGSLDSHRGGIS